MSCFNIWGTILMPLCENSNLSQIALVQVHQEEEQSVIGRNLILRTRGDEEVDLWMWMNVLTRPDWWFLLIKNIPSSDIRV